MRRRAIAVASGAFALGVLSCQLLLDVDRPRPDPPPPDVLEDPCPHRVPPGPPEKDDEPNTKRNYWLAVEAMEVPVKLDGGNHPGYDLDDSCTCSPDKKDGAAPCITPSASPSGRQRCDFDGGVDDSVAAIASNFGALASNFDITAVINDSIAVGKRTLLIHIANYNGKRNDAAVDVSLVGSGGIRTPMGCNSARGALGDAGFAPPLWDGCDRWSPRRGFTFGSYPTRTPNGGTAGYVTDNVLVARVPTLNMEFYDQPTTFRDGIVVLNLSPDPTGHGLAATGIITGRLPAKEMADILARTQFSPDGEDQNVPLCSTPFWDAIVKPALCDTRDSMESRAQEHQGEVCNASTMALGFRARPANVADDEVDAPTDTFVGCPGLEVDCPSVE